MFCPPHFPTLDDLNNIYRIVSIVKLITMMFYLSASPFLPLLQIFPSTSVIIRLCRIWQLVGKFPCSSYNPEIRFPIHISQPNSTHSHLKSLPFHSLSKGTLDKKGRHLPTSQPNHSITPSNVLPYIPIQSSHYVQREVCNESRVVISISYERFGLLDISPRDWTGM